MSKTASKGHQFTLLNGQITGVSEIKNGRVKLERMDADEAWSYDAASGQVSKTEWDDGRLETTLYADANGDGIFAKVSKSYDVGGALVTTPVTKLSGHHGGLGSDDILVGGQGTDDLTGGNGADVFDFNDLSELGLGRTHDTIQDFRVGDHDKTDLSDMDANPLLAGNQAFVFLSGAPDAGKQTGTAWFNQGNLYLSTDADSAAEFEIAVVGVSALTAADLMH